MALGLTNGSMNLRYEQLMTLNLTATHGEEKGGGGGHHEGAGGHHQARAKSERESQKIGKGANRGTFSLYYFHGGLGSSSHWNLPDSQVPPPPSLKKNHSWGLKHLLAITLTSPLPPGSTSRSPWAAWRGSGLLQQGIILYVQEVE